MAVISAFFDRPIVARTYQVRDLFLLQSTDLLDSDSESAQLWPDSYFVFGYEGYNPVVFRPIAERISTPLDFTAVKYCTGDNKTELRLRAQRRFGDDKGVCFLFLLRPFTLPSLMCAVVCRKLGKITESP